MTLILDLFINTKKGEQNEKTDFISSTVLLSAYSWIMRSQLTWFKRVNPVWRQQNPPGRRFPHRMPVQRSMKKLQMLVYMYPVQSTVLRPHWNTPPH